MLNPSAAMLREFRDHNDVTYSVSVFLSDNTTTTPSFTLTEEDLCISGCQITRTNSSEAFPLGYVYCGQLTLQIFNKTDFRNIVFENAKLIVHGVYEYGESQEFDFDLGTYNIAESTIQGDIIEMIGYDKVCNADAIVTDFVQDLPMAATSVFEACCTRCGIAFDPENVTGSAPDGWDDCEVEISYLPEDITYRQLMSAVILLFGANAYISPFDNYMYVVPIVSQQTTVIYWGGIFDSATPYATGDELNGGTFSPWTTGEVITGSFTETDSAISLDDPLSLPELAMQNIIIGGVKSTDGEYSSGSGYLLNVDVSVYDTDTQDIVNMIAAAVRDFTFRPFELDYTSYPFADLMQAVEFPDFSMNRTHNAILTHIDFAFKGVTVFKCSAESPQQLSSTSNSLSSQLDKTRVIANTALSVAESGISQVNLEVSRFNNLISNSFGVFTTSVADPNGGITYYMHDKPNLADSTKIWRMTADGFAVSTNGGSTWTAGIDSQGRAVVNVLSAIGIYADWIVTGKLSSQSGQSYWNLNTGVFVTTDATELNGFRFQDGLLNFYYSGVRIGAFSPIRSATRNTVYTNKVGMYGVNLVLGTLTEGTNQGAAVLYINSDTTGDTSPEHLTEKAIFLDTVAFWYSTKFYLGSTYKGTGIGFQNSDGVGFSGVSANLVDYTRSGYAMIYHMPKTVFRDSSPDQTGFAFSKRYDPAGTTELLSEWFASSFLSVYGSIAAESLKAVGAVTANYVGSSSDERLKNIVEWDGRYDRLLDCLEPILFSFKSDATGKKHIGVSAQKVLETLDDLGITDSGIVDGGEDIYYSVAYNELTTLLINKVKRQQEEIDYLKNRLARLEKIVEGLI